MYRSCTAHAQAHGELQAGGKARGLEAPTPSSSQHGASRLEMAFLHPHHPALLLPHPPQASPASSYSSSHVQADLHAYALSIPSANSSSHREAFSKAYKVTYCASSSFANHGANAKSNAQTNSIAHYPSYAYSN